MKEKATIYDLYRMCKVNMGCCTDCPLRYKGCDVNRNLSVEEVDELNEIILNRCEEHPIKTRQDRFLEMFPNADVSLGYLDICPKAVYKMAECDCAKINCINCQKSYWLAEVEE